MKRRKYLLYILCIMCLGGAAFSGWNLYKELQPRIEAENTYDQIRTWALNEHKDGETQNQDEEKQKVSTVISVPDFAALQAWNSDVTGWIYGPGTAIDYPIMHGSDNDYYLNHTSDKKRSIIGSIFVESMNNRGFQDDVTVVYGHHIKGGRMFSSLSGYKTQSYYEEHPILFLHTPETSYKVELFAGGILDGQTATFPLVFDGLKEREQWIKSVIAASTFQSDIYPEKEEKMIALCTCTYEFRDARYVVYGVLRPLEEEF